MRINPVKLGFTQVQVITQGRGEHFVLTVNAEGQRVQYWPFTNIKSAREFGEDLASDYGVEYEEFE